MGLFRKGNTHITAKLHRTDLVIYSHSREEKAPSYIRINAVTNEVVSFEQLGPDVCSGTEAWSKYLLYAHHSPVDLQWLEH